MHRQIAGALTGRVTKWVVAAAWIVIFATIGLMLGGKLGDQQNNEASSWLPASSESTKAVERLDTFRDENAIPTVVAYESKDGQPLSAATLASLKTQTAKLATIEDKAKGNNPVIGPLVSKDGLAAQTAVTLNYGKNGWNDMPDAADKIRSITNTPGVRTYVTGVGGQAADQAEAFGGIDGKLILSALLVVIVILLFTYRSPTLWVLPVFCAGVAYMTSAGVIYLLARYAGLTVNGQSQGILGVLVIGAGTDYALLLIARYREELRRHEDRHEAMAFALHRAAPAILASASTVVLGMLCLLFAEMNSTKGLGPVNAVGVAVTYLVMVTLLPALLVIFGRWMFWPKRPTFRSAEPNESGGWARVGRFIAPRPRRVWAVTAAVLAVACLGLLKLDANGLSTKDSFTKTLDSITGTTVLARHGLLDTSNTVQVLAPADRAGDVQDAMAKVVPAAADVKPTIIGDEALIEAPISADAYSSAGKQTARDVRAAVHAVPGANALVAGNAAVNLDISTASARDSKVIIPIVLALVLLILVVLLRAVASPLILMATVVLSFGASLGISSLLFHYVFGFAGADPIFPLFAFVFLVALGVDYNIFLMTRVREESAHRGTREGSLVALRSTGGVITSAGVVLAATFALLATIPVVTFAEIGIAVALGVLLDTMIVRSVLVTALNVDLGSRIWWPSKLDRASTRSAPTDEESVAVS